MCPVCESTDLRPVRLGTTQCNGCGASFYRFPGSRVSRFEATETESTQAADRAEFWTELRVTA